MEYKTIIGLEIHVELKTNSKMFCCCKNDSDEKRANLNVCPVCMGHPGTLPVINEEAVRKTIKTGLALNCKISEASKFDRKNYFYPDLPKGYQISQYDMPLCKEGFLQIDDKKIRIRRIHLEEDTGRLLHPEGENYSLVDFNRAGIPLMELVTEPDISSAQEARKFAEELRQILRYLDVSPAAMEKGQMRVEANVSIVPQKNNIKSKLGTKVEIKNLNSFRSVEKAIEYEIERQKEILDSGGKVSQETRGWDETKEKTFSQREKEQAHDYRYFPEPDLPTLCFSKDFIEKIKYEIPELPYQKRKRFVKEYGLDKKAVDVFVQNKELGEYFEKVMSELRNWLKEIEEKKEVKEGEFIRLAKVVSNYILTELQALLKKRVLDEDKTYPITPENFAEFIVLIYEGKISSKIAKRVLLSMFKTGSDPSHIIEQEGLFQIGDIGEIEKVVKKVIEENPQAVQDYKSGKETALQFLMGQTMKETKGRADPKTTIKLLKKLLK